MKVNLHNKVEVFVGEKKYIFYNKMYKKIFDKISQKLSFFDAVALGNGIANDNEKTQKLSNYIKKYNLKCDKLQNNIEKGVLFNRKSLVLNDIELEGEFITELGLCDDLEDDPNIYNYITLISGETPDGIYIKKGEQILFVLYIYLELETENLGLFCLGENPLIKLLLGDGLDDEIYAVRGECLSENVLINRNKVGFEEKFLASLNFKIEDTLTLSFSAELGAGETSEIVFICGEQNVARINVLDYNNSQSQTLSISSEENNIIFLEDEIKDVNQVTNITNSEVETEWKLKRFSNKLSDAAVVENFKIFNYQTPRFLSKDGRYLFFVKDDYIYGYENLEYQLKETIFLIFLINTPPVIISFN